MLALLETHIVQSRFRRKFSAESEVKRMFNIDVMLVKLYIPQRASGKKIYSFLKELSAILKRMRIYDICPHKNFPYCDILREKGFKIVGREELLSLKAAEILAAANGKEGTVLVVAEKVNEYVLDTVTALAKKYRYIIADVPEHGEKSVFATAWKYGISVEKALDNRCMEADGAIFFGKSDRALALNKECPVLFTKGFRPDNIVGGREINRIYFAVSERFRNDVPDGYDPCTVLAKAVACGAIASKDIKITDIFYGKT